MHMKRLVDDLLDVSRITTHKVELRKEQVELAEIVKGAVDDVVSLITERKHSLTVSLPPAASASSRPDSPRPDPRQSPDQCRQVH